MEETKINGGENNKNNNKAEDKKAEEKKEGPESTKGVGNNNKNNNKGEDCKPGHHCAAEPAAQKLKEIGDFGRSLDNAAADLVGKGISKVMGAISDQAQCVQLVATDLPNIVGNFISGIGNSTSSAIDKITSSINNLFSELGGREIKGYPDLFGPFETVYAVIIIKIQNIINKIALGENANQILADPNMDSKKLLDKMMRTSTRYKDAVKEAEFQGIFKEWMSNYINALLATLDIAQPEIDRINKKIKDIIEGMGDNIGKSLIHSLVNVAKAIVSNIPVVGGIVSALSSADELGQEILKFCKPPIVKGAGIVVPIINGINNQIDKIECEGNKLAKKLEPILNIKGGGGISISKASKSIGKAKASASMGGGTRKKLNNSTQRIQYMLRRFGGTRRHKFIMNKRKTRRNLSS